MATPCVVAKSTYEMISERPDRLLMRCAIVTVFILQFWVLAPLSACGETPGEFRPKPHLNPIEKVGNTGVKIQSPDTLPRSRAPGPDPKRKSKLVHKGIPLLRENELVFNAGWELIEADKLKAEGAAISRPGLNTEDWYDATVPGTVLTTLVEQGMYPDPLFGLNNLEIPESLSRKDYWYRTEFILPTAFSGREIWLQFKGINYYAEVWFNGHYLGHVTGAFVRGEFNVSAFANHTGTNVIAVKVSPPPDPGIPSEQSVLFGPGDNGGTMCLDGPTFMCTEGWDWIPAIRDRCTGLWQDVVLRNTGPVTIEDPQVITVLPLPDTSSASVTVKTEVHNVSKTPQHGTLRGTFEGVSFEKSVTLNPNAAQTVVFEPTTFPQLQVTHPRLWWPNGYGNPDLYHLRLTFQMDDRSDSDTQQVQFGIRELSYELAAKKPEGGRERVEFRPALVRNTASAVIDSSRKAIDWHPRNYDTVTVSLGEGAEHSAALRVIDDDGMGPYLVIKVNGQRIYCRGGNWGMDDAMKRISRDTLEPFVRLHRDANLTMIRNWAGQSTSEVFYDLCDEYGILVWNDFWMNTENANFAPIDHALFLENVADTIKRYRSHPSIALWCGRNEGVPPQTINSGIDRLVRELDGTRYYQPNSRLVNLCTSGPWSNQPLDYYFTRLNRGFSTEMGASSIPSAEAIRKMMAGEDVWPPDDVWAYHDFHSKGAGDRDSVLKLIAQRYGQAKDLDDLCRKAQMVNYETHRAIFEGFNSHLWNSCSGVLLWMSHPSWPSTVWQLYSSDYEPNASYFGAKHAAEPVHIQMNLPDCTIAVIDHEAAPLTNATATVSLYDLRGHLRMTKAFKINAAANACSNAGKINWPADGAYLAKMTLLDKQNRLLSENFYWHAIDETHLQELNALPCVALEGEMAYDDPVRSSLTVRLTNRSSVPALAIKLTLRNAQTGDRVLPVYYSDNYVSLLPGESREVHIEGLRSELRPQVDLSGWNIRAVSLHSL